MMSRRFLPIAALSTIVLLAACSPAVDERTAITAYMAKIQDISQRLEANGKKVETLGMALGNPPQWTDAAKAELATARATMQQLHDETKALPTPPILADAHPLFVQSLAEFVGLMDSLTEASKDPSIATSEWEKDLGERTAKAQEYAQQYLSKMQQALSEKYPDLMKE